MNKLLPCPFCGGNDIQIGEMESFWDKNETIWRVLCINCIAETAGDTKEQAIAAWNRRADHIRDATKMVSNAEPENKPLTLDELKQMDGEPVWVMHQDGSGARWGIVKDTEYGLCAVVDDDTAYWFTDVCGTIAYRSKPKEEHNETD